MMPLYSKTVYLEVDADDQDEANALVERALDDVELRAGVTNVDLAGPIEEVE